VTAPTAPPPLSPAPSAAYRAGQKAVLRCWDCWECYDTYWSKADGPHFCDCGAELRLRPEGAREFAELDEVGPC
jgi:hypothetical protein